MTAKKTTTKKAAKAAPVAVPDKGMSKGFYKTYELFQAGVTKFYGYDVDAAHTTGTHRSMKAVKAEIDTYLGSSDEMTPEAMDAEPVVQEIYALVEEASVTVAALDPVDETLAETDQYLEDFANPSEEQDAAAVVEEEEPSLVDDTDRPSMESLHRYRASHTKLSNISLEGSETYVAPKDFASIGAAQEFKSAAGGFNLIEDTVDNVAVMFAPYGPEGFFQWQTVSADAVADARRRGFAELQGVRNIASGKPAVTPPPAASPAKAAKTVAPSAHGKKGFITVLVAGNPKKPGSKRAARFALYRTGMSTAEALEAGLFQRDLDGDARKGFIAITSRKPSLGVQGEAEGAPEPEAEMISVEAPAAAPVVAQEAF